MQHVDKRNKAYYVGIHQKIDHKRLWSIECYSILPIRYSSINESFTLTDCNRLPSC